VNSLSSLYGLVTAARNGLYDRSIFKSRKLLSPVISVGNISVGGSGKTPFVILLGELLKQRGIAFDVLSRGYGRETHGTMAVAPNGTSLDFGDEPLLIAQRLGCPVIVGESRYQAGVLAEKKDDSTIHILDDGFQHRSLARDFDIVLLTSEDLHDQLLPAGRLREPLSSLRRADAVVLTEETDPTQMPPGKFVWRVRRGLTLPTAPKNPIIFCGIARPHRFVEQLRMIGIQPSAEKFYRDHHKYTRDDVRDLLDLRDGKQSGSFITTEKDAINLGPYLAEVAPVIARVQMEIVDSADVVDTILRVIAERRTKA
jgi:tetraacyldisaccharide 4'-kinase